MKPSAKITQLMRGAALALATITMAACDPILDNDYGDCTVHHHVSFRYDYNMLGVDAFARQVSTVTLYAFNADGTLAHQQTESGSALAQEGYRMTVPYDPSDYHLVAWCGVEGATTNERPALVSGTSTIDQLTCRVGGRTQGESGRTEVSQVSPLFHAEAICPQPINDDELNPTVEMSLTKNTNTLRVILNNQANKPLMTSDFDFTITDANGLMNYDNSLLPDEQLTYVPFYTGQGNVGYETDDQQGTRTEAETPTLNVAIAEFSTARLMADRDPYLSVTNRQTGKLVFRIPLIQYLLLARSQYVSGMSNQEYLDREDTYSLTFFLDEDQNWLSASILINSWRIVLSNVDIGG